MDEILSPLIGSSEPKEPVIKVSLGKDIRQRPFQYLKDLVHCPAVAFSAGNIVYGVFLGAVADIPVGSAGACAIQGLITAYTASLQVRATYAGENFGAPFRRQAIANWATAAWLLGSGIAGGPQKLAMAILPVCTFSLWGRAHWKVARYMDRKTELEKMGLSPDEISADAHIRKFEKQYLISGGTANIIAPFKNKPVNEIGGVLKTLVTHPSLLSGEQLASLAPLPFFFAGLAKSLFHNMPFIKNASNVYALGYGVAAAVAAAGGDPLFAAAQGLWSWGYRCVATTSRREKPESAVQFALRQRREKQLKGLSSPRP